MGLEETAADTALPTERMRTTLPPYAGSHFSSLTGKHVTVSWAAYFALAPVAWVPGADVAVVYAAKSLVFITAMACSVGFVRRLRLPNGILGPIGLAVLAASSGAAMLQAVSTSLAFRRLAEIVLAFAIVWAFWALAGVGYRLETAPLFAFFTHAALSAIVIGASVGVPILSEVSSATERAFGETAFAVGRTAWANSVALFFPFAAYSFVVGRSNRWWLAIAFAVSIGGVLATGGRAGLMAGLLSVAFVVIVLRPKAIPIVIAASVVVGLFTASWWLRELRAPEFAVDRLNAISSGRVAIFEAAWWRWLERPLVGFGYGQVVVDIGLAQPRAIHNLYLRLAVDGGVAFLAAFLLLIGRIGVHAATYVRSYVSERGSEAGIGVAYTGVLIVGVVVAMFEGDVLLGAMHVAVIWWACAGLISRMGGPTPSVPSNEATASRTPIDVSGD